MNGWIGASISVLAHILPSALAMVFLASVISLLSNSIVLQNMISAVIPIVAVMLGQMAYEFGEKAVKGLGWVMAIITFGISFLLLNTISLHPGIVIIIFLLYGTFHFKLKKRLNKKEKKNKEEHAS